ncbi:MAG: hypothetical protein WC584_05120 [Candidatus Pacearchaeota archaeon]
MKTDLSYDYILKDVVFISDMKKIQKSKISVLRKIRDFLSLKIGKILRKQEVLKVGNFLSFQIRKI